MVRDRQPDAHPISPKNLEVLGHYDPNARSAITPAALNLIARTERQFRMQRDLLMDKRSSPTGPSANEAVRNGQWTIEAELPENVPVFLQSSARRPHGAPNDASFGPWIDFRDSINSDWSCVVDAHRHLRQAIDARLMPANFIVRPRSLASLETNVIVGGRPVCAAVFDIVALLVRHGEKLGHTNDITLALGDIRSPREAVFWNSLLEFIEDQLRLPKSSVRIGIEVDSIETLEELDPILFALRSRATFVIAERCRFLASLVRRWQRTSDTPAPARDQIGSNRRALRVATRWLVQTAHRRGALAIAAAVEDRAKEAQEKAHEFATDLADGFDALRTRNAAGLDIARKVRKQIEPKRFSECIEASGLDQIPAGPLLTRDVENHCRLALVLSAAWLQGFGEVDIHGRTEHVGSLHLIVSQLAAWARQRATPEDGVALSVEHLRASLQGLSENHRERIGDERFERARFDQAFEALSRWVEEPDEVRIDDWAPEADREQSKKSA